ncbi:sensor histidine kinase [Marinobacterium lutimaris]|uniref:histidine kinase n=1 Tax=Marinobacterium lutimaris TaxID=568106 RepID=A0A1H6DDL6_9GAMM|nr:sensor histidine kinase [Marinobacterium lutimaris]SEG82863.1 signal transduction histidine kinase [Marinobacterium lutimaris]
MAQSLKRSLALWWCVIMFCLGGLLLIEAWASAKRSADQALDGQLEAASLAIAEAIQWPDGKPMLEMPASALQILATRWQERVFYQLIGAQGESITSNVQLPITSRMRTQIKKAPVFANIKLQGSSLRLHGREVSSAGWETQEPVEVWVAHTTEGREALAQTLVGGTLTRIAMTMLITGLILVFVMRAWLMPIRRLRQVLRGRKLDDYSALHVDVPSELRELTDTLDHLLERQDQHREALLRFIADASHQLRTPLAGLQNTSELALGSADPERWRQALETICQASGRTSRLAAQLLNLARLRHQVSQADLESINLSALVRESLMEWADRQQARGHDLGAELPETDIWLKGEAWSLHELIGNLIDNALRYTPEGTFITAGISRTADGITLWVEDNGPCTETDPQRWIAPFERAGLQGTEGSGLGLAIVASIAERHGAELRLSTCEPQGLRVCVQFPQGGADDQA